MEKKLHPHYCHQTHMPYPIALLLEVEVGEVLEAAQEVEVVTEIQAIVVHCFLNNVLNCEWT